MVRFPGCRLEASRPDIALIDVFEIYGRAPIFARRVFAPTRKGEIVPAAVSGSRSRKHDRISSIGKHAGSRNSTVGAGETPSIP